MATTLTLPYVRFVRQVTVGPGANTQFVAMMEEGLSQLKAAAWKASSADATLVAMPANTPLTFAPDDKYDAYKASKTTAASGIQTCNLGMVAYRYEIPADAISNSKYVQEVVCTIGADKFAYSGVKAAIILSDAATPPTDWEMLRNGGLATTPDATSKFATYDASPEVYGVLNSREYASVSSASNSAQEFTFDLSAVSGNYAYLYVVLSMYDYTDYRANRQYWIEGSSILNGDSVTVEFASSVTPDASTIWDGWTPIAGQYILIGSPTTYPDSTLGLLRTNPDYTPYQNISAFPEIFGVTNTGFAGDTGCTIGVDTGGKVYGGLVIRYLSVLDTAVYSKLKFSNADLLPLSGKTFRCKLCVWVGDENQSTSNRNTLYYPLVDETGIQQRELFSGIGSPTVATYYYGGPGADGTPWTFTKVGDHELQGVDYTDNDIFSVNITGGGLKVVLVTLSPITYWGTIGSDTYTTWKPGPLLYLS